MARIAGAHPGVPLEWSALLAQWGDAIPRFPRVILARLPGPPCLSDDDTAIEHLRQMVRAYCVALDQYSLPARTLANVKDPRESKYFATLVLARPILLEYKVSPISWCAFSAEVWIDYTTNAKRSRTWDETPSTAKRPPRNAISPKWVYSANRLRDRNDWYVWAESRFRGGRLHVTGAYRRLVRAWYRMRRALLMQQRMGSIALADIKNMVATHYPPDKVENTLDHIEEETRVQQNLWDRAVQRGAWLW